MKIAEAFTNRILIPFRLLPAQGLTPQKIAFSVTIGIISGLFPVIGATTLVSLLLTALFRQNLLIVQSVQWLLGLLQVLLIIPFMQFGAFLLNQHNIHLSLRQLKLAFQPGILEGIKTVGIFHLYGILSWTMLAIPASALLYVTLFAVFRRKTVSGPIV